MSGFVWLVGAGPGDPKLLTLRALEVIREADVVAHDELVPQAILALVPERTEKLRVGRRHGAGATAYKLHPDVLARARAGNRVARLKAGDPMVFGRGAEEAEELRAAGIEVEIVPGVSAALGAASCAGIPLTHRDCASHVTFATGHDGESAQGDGTLVLYMASRRLAANLARLVERGRAPETPAAYVAWASTREQQVVVGTIADLASRVERVDPSAPAVVIVGDVVRVRDRVAWSKP